MSPPDIADLFPPDKPLEDIARGLRGLTRENAGNRLPQIPCPICRKTGRFTLFPKGPHVGVACASCGREHPFRALKVMWLPKEPQP